jgi:hypothetical protein
MSILFHNFPLINVDFIRFVSEIPGKTPLFTKIPCKLLYFPTISPKFFKISQDSYLLKPYKGAFTGFKDRENLWKTFVPSLQGQKSEQTKRNYFALCLQDGLE